MSRHSNQVQGPAVYSTQPPSIKLARKEAIRIGRENQPLLPMPNNLARELFPQLANRQLVFTIQ
jgi:hypothetical protein